MDYVRMIKDAMSKGIANEEKMWKSVASIAKTLNQIEDSHPELYWHVMRKQHGIMYDHHYGPEFADYDTSQLYYTNANGEKACGPHWTKQQIVEATRNYPFPVGVTDDDKFVAFNATYADLCTELDDATILKVAYRFWFKDEDWSEGGSATKVWDYFDRHAKVSGR